MNTPLLTVVMPVYNSEAYLAEAIESILNQTFAEFFLWIIDDGSSDNSPGIIEKYARKDKRISFFTQSNKGIILTLNEYCGRVQTPLIARMDGDDIALPDRFIKQVSFLHQHPEIGIVGSAVQVIDQSVERILELSLFPKRHYEIAWKLLYTAGLSHPSVMMRTSIFKKIGGYRVEAAHVEDYDFFLRAKEVTHLANIEQPLLLYRIHDGSTSRKQRKVQITNHDALSRKYVEFLIEDQTSDEYIRFLKYNQLDNPKSARKIDLFLDRLLMGFVFRYNPANEDLKLINRDVNNKKAILALTLRKFFFWQSMVMYVRVLIKDPFILVSHLRSKFHAFR